MALILAEDLLYRIKIGGLNGNHWQPNTLSPCHLVKRNAKNQPILPSLGIQGIRQAWDVWHEPAPSHALDHGTYVGVFCVSSTTELNIMGALSGVL